MQKRFTDEQIRGFLREAGDGVPVKNLCRKHGFSDASFYQWRRRFGSSDALAGLPSTPSKAGEAKKPPV